MAKPKQAHLGKRIRAMRKEAGLTMVQLAERVGVNYATVHRVETGKVSPSVALLSEIADCLGQSVVSLLQEEPKSLHIIRASDQPLVESEKLAVRLLVPKDVINDRISLSRCQAKEGEFLSRHKTEGFELALHSQGEVRFWFVLPFPAGMDYVERKRNRRPREGGAQANGGRCHERRSTTEPGRAAHPPRGR